MDPSLTARDPLVPGGSPVVAIFEPETSRPLATALDTVPRQRRLRYGIKRLFDLVVASLLLIVLSPLLLAIVLAIAVTTRGPVLYRQPRLMQGQRPFTLYKFRTMVNGADAKVDEVIHLNHADGPLFKAKDDPRVTPVGRYLRKTFLDELPQLVNVLRGEMSLVGPRPCLPSEATRMHDHIESRFNVPQGVTGPWQTNGHHSLTFEQQMAVELEYIQSWSLSRDIWILLRTIPLVLRRTGI